MSAKADPIAGKLYEGPVHGGEGKEKLADKKPYEYMGVHKSAPNPKLASEKGYTSSRDGKEEAGFDLHAKGYAGPQNWQPKNLGTRDPDDLRHSA